MVFHKGKICLCKWCSFGIENSRVTNKEIIFYLQIINYSVTRICQTLNAKKGNN